MVPACDVQKNGDKVKGVQRKCGGNKKAAHHSSRLPMHQNQAELIHTAPELFSKEMTSWGKGGDVRVGTR